MTKLNHMICPNCGHDFYVDCAYATCDGCGMHFYATLSQTCHPPQRSAPQTTLRWNEAGQMVLHVRLPR